jgi:hypothetical protein
VVFVLLIVTLRQWQLWSEGRKLFPPAIPRKSKPGSTSSNSAHPTRFRDLDTVVSGVIPIVPPTPHAMSRQQLLEHVVVDPSIGLDTELDDDARFGILRGRVTFLGLVGQMDPPRAEVKAAGIRPVMVTGDHKATGFAIARMLGIAKEGDRAVDGRELEAMPEHELRSSLDQIAVFARVHPAQTAIGLADHRQR